MKHVLPKFCRPAPTGLIVCHVGEMEFSGNKDLVAVGSFRFFDFLPEFVPCTKMPCIYSMFSDDP